MFSTDIWAMTKTATHPGRLEANNSCSALAIAVSEHYMTAIRTSGCRHQVVGVLKLRFRDALRREVLPLVRVRCLGLVNQRVAFLRGAPAPSVSPAMTATAFTLHGQQEHAQAHTAFHAKIGMQRRRL